MSSPASQKTHNSTPESEPNHDPTGTTTPAGTEEAAAEKSSSEDNSQVKKDFAVPEGHEVRGGGGGGGKEVEEAVCGFRLFWKDHRFKDIVLEEWQNRVEECLEKADDDDEEEAVKEINNAYVQREVVKRFNITTVLKGCVRAHPHYCGPLLQAEKAARREEEEAAARKKLESFTAWILD